MLYYKDILGKIFLTIVAHPDDESFLASGTLYANKISGGKNYLLCASMGEKGSSYVNEKLTCLQIKKIRKKELMNVGEYLGIKKMKILDLPDGFLVEHYQTLEREVEKFLLKINPDYILSFGGDGYTGHSDHIVMGDIALELTKKHKISLLQFARLPKRICKDMDKYFALKRKNGVYIKKSFDCKPNLRVNIDSFVKLKSLRLHKSQFAGLNPHKIFSHGVAEHFLKNEYFVYKEG